MASEREDIVTILRDAIGAGLPPREAVKTTRRIAEWVRQKEIGGNYHWNGEDSIYEEDSGSTVANQLADDLSSAADEIELLPKLPPT